MLRTEHYICSLGVALPGNAITVRFDENYISETGFRRAGVPYFTPKALQANLKVTDLAKEWAVKKNATPAQIALAWLIAQKPYIVPPELQTQTI